MRPEVGAGRGPRSGGRVGRSNRSPVTMKPVYAAGKPPPPPPGNFAAPPPGGDS